MQIKLNIESHLISKQDIILNFQLLKLKLLGSTKIKMTEDENVKNVSHLEITEVVLVQCNIVKNDC